MMNIHVFRFAPMATMTASIIIPAQNLDPITIEAASILREHPAIKIKPALPKRMVRAGYFTHRIMFAISGAILSC